MRRVQALLCSALLYVVLLPQPADAQTAQVRVGMSAHEVVWVGQGVTLTIDLLVPGYFASAASFDLPDPKGMLLMPPAGHPLISTEIIDGTEFTVQQHDLQAWPMRAGEQSIPAFNIRFSFKRNPLDTVSVPVTLTTTAIPLTVKQPIGTEGMGSIISARKLQVTETWSPEPGAQPIKAGAAFTRTVTFAVPDVPGMVFPPFPSVEIDGLGIYSKRRLLDQIDHGALTGTRQDEITYVAKRPGQFTIPAAQYTWFDLDTQQLRSETLPARTLNVIANPQMAAENGARVAEFTSDPWSRLWYAVQSWASSWENITTTSAFLLVLLLLLIPTARRRLGRSLRAAIAPLRAVRLQPLNPAEETNHRQRD